MSRWDSALNLPVGHCHGLQGPPDLPTLVPPSRHMPAVLRQALPLYTPFFFAQAAPSARYPFLLPFSSFQPELTGHILQEASWDLAWARRP